MTQTIDPFKLKAAAEHLEWACQQYPDVEGVQALLHDLMPMIEDAKAGKVLEPITDWYGMPYRWAMSGERLFDAYKEPNIETAYGSFADEMAGGLTEDDKEIDAIIESIRRNAGSGEKS